MPEGGPLAGVRVVELAGIGPAPFCVMQLADLGAAVVRVDRVGPPNPDYTPNPVLDRGRRSVAVDLKDPRGVDVVLDLVRRSDVLVEGYRPGVCERLGLGPDVCLETNPALVYGRLSGWGQDGPWARVAGHDINYIGLTGALWSVGRAGERPVPPLNLVGDFGGGAASLALGIVSALLAVRSDGRGQVVDANVLDATATLMGMTHGLRAVGRWGDERGSNLLDTGCPYYDVYTCADGRWVAVGTVEQRFFQTLLDGLGVEPTDPLRAAHHDRSLWPALRVRLTTAFAGRPRDEWAAVFGAVDACVTPVLDVGEAVTHDHAVARRAYEPLAGGGGVQPAVSPRFSRSPTPVPAPPPPRGAHGEEVLAELGYAPDLVRSLRDAGVVG